MVVSKIELLEETSEDPAENDACLRLVVGDVTGELYKLGEVEIGDIEPSKGGLELGFESVKLNVLRDDQAAYLVDDTVHNNEPETHEQPPGYQAIRCASFVEVLGKRPGRSIGVVRLDRSTTPRRIAISIDQNVPIGVDNTNHYRVVDVGTHNGPIDLGEKHGPSGNFEVLPHF